MKCSKGSMARKKLEYGRLDYTQGLAGPERFELSAKIILNAFFQNPEETVSRGGDDFQG